jgi:hypothetical protein
MEALLQHFTGRARRPPAFSNFDEARVLNETGNLLKETALSRR